MQEYPFPSPDQHRGYELFSQELQADDLVLYHGTARRNLDSISEFGFKAYPPFESVSFAKKSSFALAHWCNKGSMSAPEDGVVIAVKFASLSGKIQVNQPDIHVFDPTLQPEIIGYCIVPHDYNFR